MVEQLKREAELCAYCDFQPKYLKLLDGLRTACAQSGRRLVLVFSPVHPALHQSYAELYRQLEQKISQGVFGPASNIVDTTHLLESTDFVDSQHPTDEGAEKFSRFLAQRIGPIP